MSRSHRLACAVACTLALGLSGCGSTVEDDPRSKPPLVRTALVEDAGATSRTFTGVVASRVQSDLGFRVGGKVVQRLVDVGETVRRGQPLMRVDATDLNLSAEAQQEAVDAAKAQAKAADERAGLLKDLKKKGVASDHEYDEAKAAERAAKAELDATRKQAQISDNASRYSVLVADTDGVVVDTAAEPGQVVSAGQTVIQLAAGGPREAVVQLPETLRPELGSTGEATLFGKDETAPATLRQLAGAADHVTRTFEAHYVLEGALADAPIGSTVSIEVPDAEATSETGGLRVPIGAVVDQGNGPGVWAIEGTQPKAAWRPVSVERLSDDYAYVTGEVSHGDRVIALGAHLIREGQRVRIDSDPTGEKAPQ